MYACRTLFWLIVQVQGLQGYSFDLIKFFIDWLNNIFEAECLTLFTLRFRSLYLIFATPY